MRGPENQMERGMGRVIVKLGGGLITDKTNLCTALPERLSELAIAIAAICDTGKQVVLVHGAGSFGHLRAKDWQLADGRQSELESQHTTDGCSSQDEAVEMVRSEMDILNGHVIDALAAVGLNCIIHPPRDWVEGTGPSFTGNVQLLSSDSEDVQVTFGDVVAVAGDREFGILSGDDLAFRLSTELPNVEALIFALGDVAGLMDVAPGADVATLLEEWSSSDSFEGHHEEAIDVTGGIFLKVARAASAAATVPAVWFVDGRHPDRIVSAACGEQPIGTRIRS